MSGIIDIVMEEKQRLSELLEIYQNEINQLPHGALSIKKIHGREYAYLAYREKDKVKFEYIGSILSDEYLRIKALVEKRKELEHLMKKARLNLKEIEHVLRK